MLLVPFYAHQQPEDGFESRTSTSFRNQISLDARRYGQHATPAFRAKRGMSLEGYPRGDSAGSQRHCCASSSSNATMFRHANEAMCTTNSKAHLKHEACKRGGVVGRRSRLQSLLQPRCELGPLAKPTLGFRRQARTSLTHSDGCCPMIPSPNVE